ncbi:glycosyltransferase [Candidatus Gracilibacteria bacterium]|nr:glycosyltransferase [Candidatus Gracilibacteria bacterium]
MLKNRLTKYSILLGILIFNIGWWSYIDRPREVKPSPDKLDCVSYNPYKNEYSLDENKKHVTPETIENDFKIIAKRFRCVRTYTTLHGMDRVPEIAEKYGLSVVMGVWVSPDLIENMYDLEKAIELANVHKTSVTHLLVGNEALFPFSDYKIPPRYLYLYLLYAQSETETPISTGEIASTWDQYRMLGDLSDFIAVHIFPYWNNVPIDGALNFLEGEYRLMTELFPNKEIFVAETGWPSNGVDHGKASANLLNEATYVRSASKYLEAKKVRYNIIEAFDQPWKIFGGEKHAGGSFGVFDEHGREKFSFSGPFTLYGMPISIIHERVAALCREKGDTGEVLNKNCYIRDFTKLLLKEHVNMVFTTLLFILVGIIYGWFGAHLRNKAFFYGSMTLLGLINIMIMIGYKAWIGHYLSLPQFWINIPLMLLPVAGILYQLRDYLKIVGRGVIRHHLTFQDLHNLTGAEPFVSLHIPSYNEEPEMLIKTIEHVTKLDYSNYELIIIENNTRDENIWRPVEKYVASLGKPNIRFYHFDELDGYKSGALNKALSLTNPHADIIGLLDADYCVKPDWLKKTIGLFSDISVSAIQCPQANKTEGATVFQKIMCYELDLFYKQGMIIRNSANAVIMNGTMCLIRHDILKKERWCDGFICEDSELGFRIQSSGGRIMYVDHTFGVGLPPRNFEEYKKQRFRWAYGAMMIFKKHWKKIFLTSELTFAQRFEYLFGWIGWGQMILYPFYLLILLFGSYFIYESYSFDAPYDFALLTLYYVAFLMLSTMSIYRDRMHITRMEAFQAVLASASLTVTIFRAVFLAVFWNHLGFKKTNKGGIHIAGGKVSWIKAHPGFIALVIVNFAMVYLSASILFRYGVNTDTLIWFLLVITITIPTMSALFFQIAYE